MFSKFEGGVNDAKSSGIIDLPTLVNKIQNNPKKELIEHITFIRNQGNISYKELKRQLPMITPNCMIKRRSISGVDFDENFIAFSQYIYFDFDIESNVDDFKKYMIEKYKDKAAMICKSCSGGGISLLFKVSNTLTRDNFIQVWTGIKENILKVEKDMIDERCKNINRAMHISYDPELFYCYENEIEVAVSDEVSNEIDRCKSQSIYKYGYNRPSFTSNEISFTDALSHVILKTKYKVTNSVVDINPIQFAEVKFPRVITDGNKRRIFSGIMYTIKYLNPNVEFEYFYRVMQKINWDFAKPKMEEKELFRLCKLHFDNITADDICEFPTRIKSIHFNPDARLGTKDKIQIANYLNAAKRKAESIDKIIKAKDQLQANCNEVTKKGVQKLTGLSYPTVLKHYNSEALDIFKLLREININLDNNFLS